MKFLEKREKKSFQEFPFVIVELWETHTFTQALTPVQQISYKYEYDKKSLTNSY